jgi:hypothetical protein
MWRCQEENHSKCRSAERAEEHSGSLRYNPYAPVLKHREDNYRRRAMHITDPRWIGRLSGFMVVDCLPVRAPRTSQLFGGWYIDHEDRSCKSSVKVTADTNKYRSIFRFSLQIYRSAVSACNASFWNTDVEPNATWPVCHEYWCHLQGHHRQSHHSLSFCYSSNVSIKLWLHHVLQHCIHVSAIPSWSSLTKVQTQYWLHTSALTPSYMGFSNWFWFHFGVLNSALVIQHRLLTLSIDLTGITSAHSRSIPPETAPPLLEP